MPETSSINIDIRQAVGNSFNSSPGVKQSDDSGKSHPIIKDTGGIIDKYAGNVYNSQISQYSNFNKSDSKLSGNTCYTGSQGTRYRPEGAS